MSHKPFSLVVVQYKETVKGAVIGPEKPSHSVDILLVKVEYLSCKHHPVCVNIEVCRHGIGIFQKEGHRSHGAFGTAHDPVIFPVLEYLVYVENVGYAYRLVLVKGEDKF